MMYNKLKKYAEKYGWVISDDLQVVKKINATNFAVVEANQLAGSDYFVLSRPAKIDLRDYFTDNEGKTTAEFTDELKSIILSYFESYERFEEAYDGDLEFRNQLLAVMIYGEESTLNYKYDKVDVDVAVDYLCSKMEQYDPLKTFSVACRVTGRFIVCVDTETENEAKKKAIEKFENADFGELEDIDMEIVNVDCLE